MNLKDADLLNAIESYKNQYKLKDYQMAELCGMTSPSVYNNWKKGTTKTLKAEYLLNFLLNTGTDANAFLEKFRKQNLDQQGIESSKTGDVDLVSKVCSDCVSKQKEIDALRETLDAKEEVLELLRGKRENQSPTGT